MQAYAAAQLNKIEYWLNISGSLTALLNQLSPFPISISHIKTSWRNPTLIESNLLNLKPTQRVYVREVTLNGYHNGDYVPWVNAISVFSPNCLKGKGRQFKFLANKPLGLLLHKQLQPSKSYRYINIPIPPLQANAVASRSTVYVWYQQKLLVNEFFLADFAKLIKTL